MAVLHTEYHNMTSVGYPVLGSRTLAGNQQLFVNIEYVARVAN